MGFTTNFSFNLMETFLGMRLDLLIILTCFSSEQCHLSMGACTIALDIRKAISDES